MPPPPVRLGHCGVSARLPPEIAVFISDHRISLDEIEVLAVMSDAPQRWWDARLICGELGLPVTLARGLLDHLAGLNMFDIRVTDEVRYRFQPGTSELAETTAKLVAAYRGDYDAVVRAAEGVTRRGALDFADAFRVRKHGRR
jgi:hypothetical protein